MTASGRAIWELMGRAARRVRLEGAVAVAVAVAALVPAALLLAWLVGGWGFESVGPLALWAVGIAVAVALLGAFGWRWVTRVDESTVAASAERARGLPEGSLRGILELGREFPMGASQALFRRSESEMAVRVAGADPRELAGALGQRARRRRSRLVWSAAGLGLLAVLVGFAAPERARAAWTPLLHPVKHLRGPVLPALTVMPGDTVVDRGRPLDVRVEARLRSHVTVHWRSVGDVPRERRVAVDAGWATATVGPVQSALSYWVRTPDGAVSDTFTATPRDPLMVTGLSMDVTYPPHVGRSPDHYQGDPPVLEVPEGTRLLVAGRASGVLAAVRARRADGAGRVAAVEGTSFQLDWTVASADSGRWEWALSGRDAGDALAPAAMEIRVIEDAPPEVRINVPGADTLMPPTSRQPILAAATDDYGLTSAMLVFRTVNGGGERGSPVSMAMPVPTPGPRASLRGLLDASGHPLVPGDAIEYHVEVRDNSPVGQTGRSATYLLRLPGMEELRDRARREAAEMVDETRSLADRARELESSTRDLSRRAGSRGQPGPAGGEPGADRPPERLAFQEASEARDVAGKHEEMMAQADALRARMEELERAVAEAGLRDPDLKRRMDELQELYERLASPELREQVEALREAVEALDPAAVERALERLAEAQEEFREQVARSLEMMRRAVAEQEMNALARQAEDIAGRQEALAEAMREEVSPEEEEAHREGPDGEESREESGAASSAADSADSPPSPTVTPPQARIEQQEQLEEEAEELAESLRALQQQLMQLGEQDASQQAGSAGEKGKASQESMAKASEEARSQRGEEAAAAGERAASQMSDAARTLDEARQQMAESGQRESSEAVQQATREALSLAERQEALRREMEQAQRQGGARGESLQQMRSEQAALQQGLEQMGRNLGDTGQRSAAIEQQVRRALERAQLNMERTLEGLQESGRMPVREAEQSVESLNQLAMSLLENDARMQRAQAPGGVQQALRQLAQAAQEQGSVNGRATALAPMQLAEQALARQLTEIGRQQREVARRIGEASGMLGGRDDVLGRLDPLSSEAAAIARELEGGRLTPEVMARQERLFHRLLDAGRSLEGEEQSDERVGRAPGETDARAPDALDPAVMDPSVRYPAPTAEQLERLPAAYRRLILEYFDRLNRGAGVDG